MNHDCNITRQPWLFVTKEHGQRLRIEACKGVMHQFEGFRYSSEKYYFSGGKIFGAFAVLNNGLYKNSFHILAGDGIGLN